MKCIGCDVHKKLTMVAWVDTDTGEVRKPYKIPTSQLAEHLSKFDEPTRSAVETSTVGQFVTRQLQSCGLDVLPVDAFKVHRLLQALNRGKSDKLDAMGLALLLANGCLDAACVWVPDELTLQLRELTRTRDDLRNMATATKNRMRKLLARHGLDCPRTNLLGVGARQWLAEAQAKLPLAVASSLQALCSVLDSLAEQIAQLEAAIVQMQGQSEAIQLLLTIPGVGDVLSAILAAEIGDIHRFESAAKLRSYSGIVPQVSQSGERCWTGPLVNHGNRMLSWAMIQTAGHFAQSAKTQDTQIMKRYRRLVYQTGPNPAKVSLARHLSDVIYAMLRDRRPFDISMLQWANGVG
jgi:transposase